MRPEGVGLRYPVKSCVDSAKLAASVSSTSKSFLLDLVSQPKGEETEGEVKPFGIAKRVGWEAYRQVKANRGAASIA